MEMRTEAIAMNSSAKLPRNAGRKPRGRWSCYHCRFTLLFAEAVRAGHLGCYFSNGNRAPGSDLLDSKDWEQVADHKRKLQEIYSYIY